MSEDFQTDPILQMPPAAGGSPGTEGVWADIDRAYDADFRHNLRVSRLTQRNASFAAQQFQAQMLGLALLSDSEFPLVADPQGPPADPIQSG